MGPETETSRNPLGFGVCTYFPKPETRNPKSSPKPELVSIIPKPHFMITLIKLDQNHLPVQLLDKVFKSILF
jgi:hypothetical protein